MTNWHFYCLFFTAYKWRIQNNITGNLYVCSFNIFDKSQCTAFKIINVLQFMESAINIRKMVNICLLLLFVAMDHSLLVSWSVVHQYTLHTVHWYFYEELSKWNVNFHHSHGICATTCTFSWLSFHYFHLLKKTQTHFWNVNNSFCEIHFDNLNVHIYTFFL